MADFRKLRVWDKADSLAMVAYDLAAITKSAGHPDLADQIKRSAGSIPFNIAEGSGHRSRREFARFLGYSIASSCELENQLAFARNVRAISYADCATTSEKIIEVRKMLRGLVKKLEG